MTEGSTINRDDAEIIFFDFSKWQQERKADTGSEKVTVILNYPRKAKNLAPDPTSKLKPLWLVMGYSPPPKELKILNKWKDEYIYDEENERGWRERDIFAP